MLLPACLLLLATAAHVSVRLSLLMMGLQALPLLLALLPRRLLSLLLPPLALLQAAKEQHCCCAGF